MGYSLYTTDHCHACSVVLEFVEQESIKIEVYPTDRKDRPHDAFVFPALFKDERLIAYGDDDIIEHFVKSGAEVR